MTAAVASFLAGGLFAVGLGVSGMTQPGKIVGFLDLFGDWDASLALVMLGAVGVHALLYRVITRRAAPLFDVRFHLPTRRDLDARLLFGSAIFGVGWALGGYCPGPALVAVGSGSLPALVFAAGMVGGMKLEHVASMGPIGCRRGA